MKAYIFLGVLFAAILSCSTAVEETSADAKKSNEVTETNEAIEPDQYGGGCRYGCCGRGPYGCRRCCRTGEEVKKTNEADNSKEPEQYGGGCRYGCCSRGRYGCQRCCKAAGEEVKETNEAADVATEPEKYGGRCRYGCCMWGHYGCQKCCKSEHEAKGTNPAAGDGKNDVAGSGTKP